MILLKFQEKILKIHKQLILDNLNTQKIEFHAKPYLTGSFTGAFSKVYFAFNNSNSDCPEKVLCFILKISPCSTLDFELSRANCSCSHFFMSYIYISFSWRGLQTILKSTTLTVAPSNTKQLVGFLYSCAESHHISAPLK